MVPQKNNEVVHNFKEHSIKTYIDGDWVKAEGTTLGADNGLGVAAIMSVLEDKDLKHGPLEVLITKDEETGMVGAFGLKAGTLNGEILLNLDTEEEGELCIGCAGGLDITATAQYQEVNPSGSNSAFKITLKGLRGGHSGLEINEGRANANKLMAYFMYEAIASGLVYLGSWKGGNMRNAIPREAQVVLAVDGSYEEVFLKSAADFEALLNKEYGVVETSISFKAERTKLPKGIVPEDKQRDFVHVIYACPNGVVRMIPTIPDTVETSSNLAIVSIGDGEFSVEILARSSSDNMKADLANSLESCFNLIGMKVERGNDYCGWQPNVNSSILHAMKASYKQQFGKDPEIKVVHAGLECGIIGAIMKGLDMISFGPTLRSPHSPDERVYVPSVAKFYDFLRAVLENIPAKE
jgi:dipeptidase D